MASCPNWREEIYKYQLSGSRRKIPGSVGQLLNDDRILTELITNIYDHREEEIDNITVQPLSPGSDIIGNLSESVRLRIRVKLNSGQKVGYNWFVKLQPTDQQNAKLMADLNLFQNEIEFYQKVAPELRNFMELNADNTEGHDVEFDIPELIHADIDEEGAIIILEDLVSLGYKQERDENGEKFLSIEKALLCVASIAKIQAASYAMQVKKNTNLGQDHPTLVLAAQLWTNEEMMARLQSMKDHYCQILRESHHQDSPALCDRFSKAFDSPENLKELCRLRQAGEDRQEISCLQHGDFHFNNLMFREEAGGVTRLKVLDWQMAYTGRPGGDVAYLLMSSLSPETYEEQEQVIKRKYFEEFNKTFCSLVQESGQRVEKMLEEGYKKSLPLGFLLSCGNVYNSEREKVVSFAYLLCNEAAHKNLI